MGSHCITTVANGQSHSSIKPQHDVNPVMHVYLNKRTLAFHPFSNARTCRHVESQLQPLELPVMSYTKKTENYKHSTNTYIDLRRRNVKRNITASNNSI
jgi:hypothetical protein